RPAEVLHRDRYPVERPADPPGLELPLGGARGLEDPRRVERDERVQRGLEPAGAGEERLAQLDRRQAPGGQPDAELGDAEEPELRVAHGRPPAAAAVTAAAPAPA